MRPGVSIIIPVYREEKTVNHLIGQIKDRFSGTPYEIIVVDGDPKGATIATILDSSAIRRVSPKGRAKQMNAGAKHAAFDILFFLHADVRLPQNTSSAIARAFKQTEIKAGAFDLGIDSRHPLLKIIEKAASIRSKLTRIPYGDQGIFILTDIFEEIGGYSEIPIMEDIDLMQKLKRKRYPIVILNEKMRTSPRRWEKQGIIYGSLKNVILSTLFYLGANPDGLKHYY